MKNLKNTMKNKTDITKSIIDDLASLSVALDALTTENITDTENLVSKYKDDPSSVKEEDLVHVFMYERFMGSSSNDIMKMGSKLSVLQEIGSEEDKKAIEKSEVAKAAIKSSTNLISLKDGKLSFADKEVENAFKKQFLDYIKVRGFAPIMNDLKEKYEEFQKERKAYEARMNEIKERAKEIKTDGENGKD